MPTNAIKKQLHLYFGSNGTLLDKQGDLSANAQDDETFVINAYIEDGVVDNQTTLINFTPQDTMAYTSDWFAMFYRELVSYVVPTESEPRVFAKFSITVPSIILLVKSGKEQFTQRITIIQRYGNTHLGNFETLAQLNVDFPPTQTLDENNDVAFVYSNEQGQTNQVGFYQVEYIEGNHVWVKKESILYNLATKQFNFLGLTVNVGFSNPRGVPTVAQSTIYQLMQELNSQAVRLQIVEDDLQIAQNDIVDLQDQIDKVVDGTTDIAFDNADTDLNSTFVEEAIKEVNDKANANEQNIVDMKDGTTIVKKAEQDKNGNDIVNTYETKVIVSGIDSRVTNLENANMVKSVSYEPMTHIITFTFYDNTTQSLDLPLESTIIGASYDNVTKDITFTLQNGSTLVVPLDDLVSGLASETWVTTYFIPKTMFEMFKQQLRGYNLAVPNLTGKTEISAGVYRLYNANGITVDYNVTNGEYTINGTAIGTPSFVFITPIQAEQYTLSYHYVSGQMQQGNILINNAPEYNAGIRNYSYDYTDNKQKTFTQIGQNEFYMQFFGDAQLDNFTFKLQLEKGSTATPYTIPGEIPQYKIVGDVNDDIALTTRINNKMIDIRTTRYIAHRGVSGIAPENTLPAYDWAGKLGYWGAECDISVTSDGKWILMHDNTVDRTTNGTGAVSSFTLSQIKELNIDGGSNVSLYPNLKVPTFEEYLIVCKKHGLVPIIEIKSETYTTQNYVDLLESIKKIGFINDVIIISFSIAVLNSVRELNKDIKMQYLPIGNFNSTHINTAISIGNCDLNYSFSSINKDNVEEIHASGLLVNSYTVNSPQVAKTFLEYCVDFLTTDILLEVL